MKDTRLYLGPWTSRLIALAVLAASPEAAGAGPHHPWLSATAAQHGTLEQTIDPPPGFKRAPYPAQSFARWLRSLPVKSAGAPVLLFNGQPKSRQDVHAAVLDIDTGPRDLQQCADAVMRLRAEWLYAQRRYADIGFNFTNGMRANFSRYAGGERPNATAKIWRRSAKPDDSYKTFRSYMSLVFAYAGTHSLSQELRPASMAELRIGDVFIKGGFPGHAVLVADMAANATTGEKRFLLLQSYMPAQDIHVLKNPADPAGSPWYAPPSGPLVTPEWTFLDGSLKRWPQD